jgi:hypothetical protein
MPDGELQILQQARYMRSSVSIIAAYLVAKVARHQTVFTFIAHSICSRQNADRPEVLA